MTFNSQILNNFVCAKSKYKTKEEREENTSKAPTYDFKNNNKGNFRTCLNQREVGFTQHFFFFFN